MPDYRGLMLSTFRVFAVLTLLNVAMYLNWIDYTVARGVEQDDGYNYKVDRNLDWNGVF